MDPEGAAQHQQSRGYRIGRVPPAMVKVPKLDLTLPQASPRRSAAGPASDECRFMPQTPGPVTPSPQDASRSGRTSNLQLPEQSEDAIESINSKPFGHCQIAPGTALVPDAASINLLTSPPGQSVRAFSQVNQASTSPTTLPVQHNISMEPEPDNTLLHRTHAVARMEA